MVKKQQQFVQWYYTRT